MGTKLRGMLNLSRIPKELIVENKNAEKVVWVDILENLNGADQYGNTHSVSVYDKAQKKAVYLGNLRPQEFGQGATAQPAVKGETFDGNAPEDKNNDLPF